MEKILFVTGNVYKFQIAQRVLSGARSRLIQKKLKTPEIQSASVQEVAAFSARWTAGILKKPVVVADGGCYIEALNGFPGPFVKYVNQRLRPGDLLNLMKSKRNRRAVWKECLAYCAPGERPVTFVSSFPGSIAKKAGTNTYRKNYGWIDSVFIPRGHARPLSEMPTPEWFEFWSGHANYKSWQKLLAYLESAAKQTP